MALDKEEREVLPFFIIVTAVMVFLYGLALYNKPGLRELPKVAVFSFIMGIHAFLHWLYGRVFVKRGRVIIYFIVQSCIAQLIIWYTKELSLVFGLILPLVGEETGTFRGIKALVIVILINTAQMAVSLLLLFGGLHIEAFYFAGMVPLILFVIIYVNLYSRQTEARQEAQQLLTRLETSNSKLRESNLRIESLTLEQERQRMARELHDTLAQGLSGLVLQLEASKVYLAEKNNEKADEIITKALFKARETLSTAREAIDGLRGKPEAAGFREFLKKQEDVFASDSGIVYKSAVGVDPGLTRIQRINLEKIVSELLLNCVKHSGASEVDVRLSVEDGVMALSVSDNGRGFDPGNIAPGHFGLKGIRERCELIGAEFRIKSVSGTGTEAVLTLPLPSEPGALNV